MPEFEYKALDKDGRTIAGVISALDRAAAIAQLGSSQTYVTDLAPRHAKNTGKTSTKIPPNAATPRKHAPPSFLQALSGRRVSPRQRVTLLNQLTVGLSAGLPLVSALEVVGEQAENPAAADLIADLIERVTAGDALSDAMAQHPQNFSTMQISMIRAGETAGALDNVMASLAAFAERDLDLREKLRSAAIYPLMVVALGAVSIAVIMGFILPRIMTVVSETGGDLPLPTRILMTTTDALRSPSGIAFALAAAAALAFLWRYTQTPQGSLTADRLKLKLPFLGTAIRRVAVSRFARTLATLAAANIPIVESMRIVRDTLGNEQLARHIDTATDGIVRGSAIADELRDTQQFPPLLIQVIAMGERTGRLDELLMNTADSYDKETNAALERVMTIVPVLFILILALFVAFILAAALLPIMGMDLGVPE